MPEVSPPSAEKDALTFTERLMRQQAADGFQGPDPRVEKDILADPRVKPDSFVVYPTDYDLIPYSDRDSWALTVTNGHAYGWSIRPGIGVSGSVALNRKGERIFESRGSGRNKARRWPLEEALRIALSVVDSHKVSGISAAEAVAKREQIIAAFERPVPPAEPGEPDA